MGLKIEGEKIKAKFIERPNRFQAVVEIDGEREIVHVPNTGRLKELLIPGATVYLLKSNDTKRKTKYTLMFVEKGENLICIYSSLANRVLENALKEGQIHLGYGLLKREVVYGESKFDFMIEGENKTYIEVKCVTLEEDGIAKFPDAPTERGVRHIHELIDAKKKGYISKIVLIAFMDYVKYFVPNYITDKKFYEALKKAKDEGVDIMCLKCKITVDEISIINEIPVNLDIDIHSH